MAASPELKAARKAWHRLEKLHAQGEAPSSAVDRARAEVKHLESIARRTQHALTVAQVKNLNRKVLVTSLPGGGPVYRMCNGAVVVSSRWHYPVDGVVFARGVLYDINDDGQPCNPRRAPLLPGTKTAFHLSKDNHTLYLWTPKATRAKSELLINDEALGFKFTRVA
jgi:hypothetical protein